MSNEPNLEVLLGFCRQMAEYLARPTIGLPSDRDPALFAQNDAGESLVRTALANSIRIGEEIKSRLDETGRAMEWVKKYVFDRDETNRAKAKIVERLVAEGRDNDDREGG